MSKKTILVTQCDMRFGYNVAKSLTEAGYRVVAGVRSRPAMCSGMVGVIGEISYPEPFSEPLGYISALETGVDRFGVEGILPVHEDIFIASYYRALLKVPVIAPKIEVLIRLNDKLNLFQMASASDVSSPPIMKVKCIEDVYQALSKFRCTILLKPRFGEGGRGIVRIANEAEVSRRFCLVNQYLEQGGYLAQPVVGGVGIGVGCLLSGYRPVAVGGHIRLREVPTSGGTSTARATFIDHKLYKASLKILANEGFTGLAMLEYRYDEENNKYSLIDINPRYWGSMSVYIESGIDFPRLHIESALENIVPSHPIYPSSEVESRWALGELKVLADLLVSMEFKKVSQMLRSRHDRKIIYEDLTDGRVFISQIWSYLKRAYSYHPTSKASRSKVAFFSQFIKGKERTWTMK